MPIGVLSSYYTLRLTGNDKGLYATKNKWRIDP